MENEKKPSTSVNLDIKDTAGYLLMEHEERMQKLLSRIRGKQNENTNVKAECKD
uniref:Uncharacterized protein n=1 Tax=uncultured prokaryote TaxID=198431 RepID=A0A0H5QP77_9ZZZZ|nr:hypothetical protein [uncultured prokaryote]